MMTMHLHLEDAITWNQLRDALAPYVQDAFPADSVVQAVLRRANLPEQGVTPPEGLPRLVSWLTSVNFTVSPLPIDLADGGWPLEAVSGFVVRSQAGAVWDPLAIALITVMGRSDTPAFGRVAWAEERRDLVTSRLLFRMVASREEPGIDRTIAVLLTTNIDDMPSETLGYVLDRLLREGARDAWIAPVMMKKSRAAVTLHVLASPDYEASALRTIFEETTTLGVRRTLIDTYRLARRVDLVTTEFGNVHVKIGFLDGKVRSLHPEFEDCAYLARRYRVPLQRVYDQAVSQWRTNSPVLDHGVDPAGN